MLVGRNYIREVCTMDTDERLMLYQIAIQDIRDFKANQWRISHYGVLIQVALVAADLKFETSGSWIAELWLSFISVATFGVIIYLIYEILQGIVACRNRYQDLGEPIEESVKTFALKLRERRKPSLDETLKSSQTPLFLALFSSVQIFAMVLAMTAIWW